MSQVIVENVKMKRTWCGVRGCSAFGSVQGRLLRKSRRVRRPSFVVAQEWASSLFQHPTEYLVEWSLVGLHGFYDSARIISMISFFPAQLFSSPV